MIKILVAEDDPATQKYLCAILKLAGYETVAVKNGIEASDMLAQTHIDLLLCDIMMPGMDGYELTRSIRDSGSLLPVLMLTAKNLSEDMRNGFLSGTDDYMVKPPDRQELLLRIKALLRRARIEEDRRIILGNVILDHDTHTVQRENPSSEQVLPPKEFDLLYLLLSYPDHTFTRIQLLDAIWGMESDSDEKTVNVHINRLRSHFEGWPEFEIQTVRGLGYRAVRLAQSSS